MLAIETSPKFRLAKRPREKLTIAPPVSILAHSPLDSLLFGFKCPKSSFTMFHNVSLTSDLWTGPLVGIEAPADAFG